MILPLDFQRHYDNRAVDIAEEDKKNMGSGIEACERQ
jgi:hypothetical protein